MLYRNEINTAGNSTYPKVAVQWLNQALYFYQSLCLVDSEVLRNRHLRVAAKRCATYKETQPHKQHIWFLLTQKPTLKNQKSCFLPTLGQSNRQGKINFEPWKIERI